MVNKFLSDMLDMEFSHSLDSEPNLNDIPDITFYTPKTKQKLNKMNLKDLSKPLPIESVEFRIQSINKGGYATILAYKDARVDMNRLDAVVGPQNWQRDHYVVNGSMYCKVSIFNEQLKQWVSKSDVGSETFTEKEKGLASDAFKRACFNWGIGRELYDYPTIQIKLDKEEFTIQGDRAKQTYKLELKKWKWYSEFTNGVLTYLGARDNNNKVRFNWGFLQKKKTSK